jgi:pilus assembly protein Flp/PilA
MKKLKEMIQEFFLRMYAVIQSKRGQGLVEYALLLVLIALVVILMLKGSGKEVNKVFSKINSALGTT